MLDSPASASPVSLPSPAFVGREAEIERLTRRLKEAQKGHGCACVVIGDPGIGKSRMAAELAKFATLQGIRTSTVSCQRSNVERPLSVLVDLVPALREMPGAIGCSQETLQVLRRLTEFDTRGVELSVSTAESHALHRGLRNALFDLLDAVTDEVSLVLVFDDVQWIDRTSADILAQMVAWAKDRRFLLILNARSGGTELLEGIVRGSAEVIELNALTHSAAEALLGSIVTDGALSDESTEARRILDVGEGNPFFLQELTKHWLESAGSVEAPSSVSKVLRDRLWKLSPVSLKVLQACTVLGQSATVERVDKVLEYASHELLGAIQELSAAGMLSCSTDSPGIAPLSLRTRHDLLSNAVLEGLSSASRGFLHRRAGLVLEKELLGDRMSTALLWECAFHWHHAGDRDRALSVVRSCSEHLLEVGLPRDASEALDRALEYCSTDEQRLAVLARQVDALQMDSQWKRSKEVLVMCRELRKRTTSSNDEHDTFEIMLFDAAHRSSLDVLPLLQGTTLCVNCEDASPEHRLQAVVIALKLASDVDPKVMDALYQQVERLIARTPGDDPNRIEAEMVYHTIRGDGSRGIAAARTLVDIARQSKEPVRLVRALGNLANSCRINGTQEELETCLHEMIEYSLKHHMVERAAIGIQNLVKMCLSMGDLGRARDVLEQRRALPVASENLVTITEQHVLEARIAIKEGKPEIAAMQFAQVPEVSFAFSPSRRAHYLALEIHIRIALGCSPDVLRPLASELEKIHTKIWEMGLQDSEAESLFLALRAIGEEPRGRELLTEYLNHHRRDRMAPASHLAHFISEGDQPDRRSLMTPS
ncbi:MAG: AAA family ATPase [Gemmatimonadota bacterium]|nr:AAA family ATPase [Gemmatimonadota bacterium]